MGSLPHRVRKGWLRSAVVAAALDALSVGASGWDGRPSAIVGLSYSWDRACRYQRAPTASAHPLTDSARIPVAVWLRFAASLRLR